MKKIKIAAVLSGIALMAVSCSKDDNLVHTPSFDEQWANISETVDPWESLPESDASFIQAINDNDTVNVDYQYDLLSHDSYFSPDSIVWKQLLSPSDICLWEQIRIKGNYLITEYIPNQKFYNNILSIDRAWYEYLKTGGKDFNMFIKSRLGQVDNGGTINVRGIMMRLNAINPDNCVMSYSIYAKSRSEQLLSSYFYTEKTTYGSTPVVEKEGEIRYFASETDAQLFMIHNLREHFGDTIRIADDLGMTSIAVLTDSTFIELYNPEH